MGIFDFLKGEFIDVIHWTDDSRDTLVWRFEREDHEIKYGANVMMSVLPPSGETYSNASETFTYRQYEVKGEAAELNLYGSAEFPTVELAGAEFTKRFFSMGASYSYSIQEMRASAKLGIGLDSLKASAVRRVIDNKLDQTMIFGSANGGTNGIRGLFNAPNVTNGALAAAGLWSAKDPDAIARDVAKLRSDIRLATLGNYDANVLLLAQSVYERLATARLTSTNGTVGLTALEYLRQAQPDLRIVASSRLDQTAAMTAAGVGVGVKGALYCFDAEVAYSVNSQSFEQFAPQWDGMRMNTACHARSGGVVVRIPAAVSYLVV